MLSIKFRLNLLVLLFVLAIILIGVNIFVKKNLRVFDSTEVTVDAGEISNQFKNIIAQFDIADQSIKEKKVKDKNSGQEFSVIKVEVPGDLSIPEILQDVFISYQKDSLIITSVEKVKNGKTILTLRYEEAIVLQAELDYSKGYFRNKGSVAFILNNVDPENSSITALIESPVKLNFLIHPKNKYLDDVEFIIKNGQQFSILIDDDIDEQKYRFHPSYSEQRVISVIKSLVSDFQKAACFIIDDKSNFYNSPNYKILNKELAKRKIKFFREADFINLINNETLVSSFLERMENIRSNKSNIFLVDEETYSALNPELVKISKKGYRIVTSSLILP